MGSWFVGDECCESYDGCVLRVPKPDDRYDTYERLRSQFDLPGLNQQQCEKIFTALQPQYTAWIAQATAWANQQCSLFPSDLGTGSQWNLETADVNAIMAQWSNPEPGCIDEQNAVLLAQAYANTQCPCPSAAELLSKFSPPLTSNDAHKIVQNWKYNNGSLVCAASGPASSSTSSKIVKGTVLVGGLGAIGLALYAARHGMSIPKAASTLYGAAKTRVGRVGTTLKRSTRKLRARL